jgi:simple sugar transport system ATP-binding protein
MSVEIESARLVGVSKSFGASRVVDRVDLTLDGVEVIGLAGDNGSGKTTLMKILAGVFPPDEGFLEVNGGVVVFGHPKDALKVGIRMVYQHLGLCGDLDVRENIFMGQELVRRFLMLPINRRQLMLDRARNLLDMLGASDVEVSRKVNGLSGGQKQAVAIARCLVETPRILILDEPTAALSAKGRGSVIQMISDFRNRGVSVVFISHNLEDLLSVSDRIVVLRQGVKVAEVRSAAVTEEDVCRLMARG